jgi:hypothetical protein
MFALSLLAGHDIYGLAHSSVTKKRVVQDCLLLNIYVFLQSKLAATLIRRLVNNSQQNKNEVFNNASIFFSPRSGLSFFTMVILSATLRESEVGPGVPCPAVRVHMHPGEEGGMQVLAGLAPLAK